MAKEKKITVKDMLHLLNGFKANGHITDDTEIWLASDEEGNSYSPFMAFKNGSLNAGVNKEKLTLYPSSMHTEH